MALLVAAATAGPAEAGTVRMTTTLMCWSQCAVVDYRAAAGERNEVTIERLSCTSVSCPSGHRSLLFSDPAGVSAGSGCVSYGPGAAVCSWPSGDCSSGPCSLLLGELDLGDLADSVVTSPGNPALLRVHAGPGDDLVRSPDVSWVDGGPGDDSIAVHDDNPLAGAAGAQLLGGEGNDLIEVVMVAGNNMLIDGGPGADRMDGGVVDYSTRTVPIQVTPDGAPNDGAVGEGDDIGPNLRGAQGGDADDVLTAGTIDSILRGNGGNDSLTGGNGGDNLIPGEGADTVSAGAGNDFIQAHDAADTADAISCGAGVDTVRGDYTDPFDEEDCEVDEREPPPDTARPSSQVSSAPAIATSTPVPVAFTASDPAPSAGLREVLLYVKEPGATAYTSVATASPSTGSFSWSPAKEGTHALYTVAIDRAGNVEGAPSEPDASTRVDFSAPTVTAYAPTGASVNPSAKISVTFSEDMDRAATQQAFRLTRSDGATLTGSFAWSGATMTFTPAGKLERSTSYTARVATTAKDLAGRPLSAEHLWSFRTS